MNSKTAAVGLETAARALSALLVGLMTVSFTIAFTAMIYTGPLAPHVAQGLAHSLLGTLVSVLVGTLLMSYKGAVMRAQDLPAIMLAGSLAAVLSGQVLSPETMAATAGATIVLASLAAGVGTLLFGMFRLGGLARFIPHPVIGGFLAATGYLMVMAAVGMCLQDTFDIRNVDAAIAPGALARWAPWVLAGLALALVSRRTGSRTILPATITVLFFLFYAVLAVRGISLAEAASSGLLLGPFGSTTLLVELNARLLVDADWSVLLAQLPILPAIMAMTVLGTMLGASGLETILGRDFHMEKDLRGTGAANIGAALAGGIATFHGMAEPTLAHKAGVTGRLAPLAAAGVAGATLLLGAGVLELMPVGVFAALVAYLGFDMLFTWLWDSRRTLKRWDYLLVAGILSVAVFQGFLVALVAGFMAASVLFLVTYARIDIVRLRSSAGEYRSRVERSVESQAFLSEVGRGIVIRGLDGYLFFGTASKLRNEVRALLDTRPPPRRVILDFTRVSGIDASAMQSLAKIAGDCDARDVALDCTGMDPDDARQLNATCAAGMAPTMHATLDSALEAAEAGLLTDRPEPVESDETRAILQELERLADTQSAAVLWMDCPAGTRLITRGAAERDLYLLREGLLRAEVEGPKNEMLRVAAFRPGAIIGELAHYADLPRTADIVCDTASRLLRVNIEELSRTDPGLAGRVHDQVARVLARRVATMTALLRHAGI